MQLDSEQKRSEKIRKELTALWAEAFGDEEEYISLIFPFLDFCPVFAQRDEKDKIVSAFYLLPCYIEKEGRTFSGMYLYAAATAKSHRGRGIMARLIKEGCDFCKDKFDFMALVPGEESLYGYYAAFGFESRMYRFKSTFDFPEGEKRAPQKTDSSEYSLFRKKLCKNAFHFSKESENYVFGCYEFYGSEFLRLSDEACLMYDREEKTAIELLCDNEDIKKELEESFEGKLTVYSRKGTVKEKCGMLLPFSKEAEKLDNIYNNLTLE